jgi:hypothetical protein
VVAIAAKNARLAWAVLKFGEDFRLKPSYGLKPSQMRQQGKDMKGTQVPSRRSGGQESPMHCMR